MDVRACIHSLTHTEKKKLACTFVHLTLLKHLVYMLSFMDHTLRVAKLPNLWFFFFLFHWIYTIHKLSFEYISTVTHSALVNFLCFCHTGSIFCCECSLFLWGNQTETCSGNTQCQTFTLLPPRFWKHHLKKIFSDSALGHRSRERYYSTLFIYILWW